jgi:hypothetical protein
MISMLAARLAAERHLRVSSPRRNWWLAVPVALAVAGCGSGTGKAPAVAPTAPVTTTETTTTTTPPSVTVTPTVETVPAAPRATARSLPQGATVRRTTAPRRQAVSYANCADVRAHGAAPIHQGDPGWAPKFDRDGDGVGCE